MRHTAARSTVERETKEKDGVFTGRYAVNPVNGEAIPIWVADYVLMEYGTGAIMAVPAHDERDHAFAETYGLEIRQVVAPADGSAPAEEGAYVAHTDDEVLVNSGEFTGLSAPEGKTAITAWLAERGLGEATIGYRLRDWLLSRQRYWGCPIPIVHCDACGVVPVPADQLPVLLPEIDDYLPKGKSPLAAAEDWVTTTCPSCGGPARRETDTMDTFVDSSWYFLRYADARNDDCRVGPADRRLLASRQAVHRRRRARRAAPALRAVLHEGAQRHGAARLPRAVLAPVHAGDDLPQRGEDVEVEGQRRLARRGDRAATARTRFASTSSTWGRPSTTRSGATTGSRGPRGCSTGSGDSCWRSLSAGAVDVPADGDLIRTAHRTIDRVSDDILRRFQFHTPIAALFELVNEIYRVKDDPARAGEVRFATETVLSLVQPYAPHVAEELWERLGHSRLREQPWPEADPALVARGHGRGRRAGQRQAPRPPAGRRPGRRRPSSCRSRSRPSGCRRT